MVRRRIAVLAGLSLVLAGCGSAAAPGSGGSATSATVGMPTQPPPSTPFPSRTLVTPAGGVVTSADDGVTVTLGTGQRLTVDLAPGPGAYAWDRPQLSGSGLRLVSAASGYPGNAPMRAIYLATAPGTAVLSAVSDAPCLHQQPRCSIPQRVWTVRVVIRPQR